MIYTTNPDKANEILKDFKNRNLLISSYTKNLNKIIISLDRYEDDESIIIHSLDCEEMTGCFDYDRINLQITQEAGVTNIFDRKAGFELIALGGFVLLKGTNDEFRVYNEIYFN